MHDTEVLVMFHQNTTIESFVSKVSDRRFVLAA